MDKKLLIIAAIPAYNEEKTIAKVVLLTQKYVDKVIVCDDGSKDMTAEIAEKVGATVIRHERNMGKGSALQTLFKRARGLNADVMVTLDADGQHNPSEIQKLIQPILSGEVDITVGSRFLVKNIEMPFYRQIGNRILNKLVNLFGKRKITDTQSGYRAYNKRAIQRIEIATLRIGVVDSEILMKAHSHNLKIKEIPINCIYKSIRTPAYNPVRYLLSVMAFIVRYASLKHPLLIFGLPGTATLSIGVLSLNYVLQVYFTTRQFAVSIMLMSMIAILAGILAIMTAIILYAITYLVQKP